MKINFVQRTLKCCSSCIFALTILFTTPCAWAKDETPSKSNTQKPKPLTLNRKAEPQSDPQISPQSFDASRIADMVFEYTNQERRRTRLGEFRPSSYLTQSANGHSADMAQRNYFSHKSKGILKRKGLRDRVQSTGFSGAMIAENIAMLPTFNTMRTRTSYGPEGQRSWVETDGNTYSQLAANCVQQWMNSPGHRQNILNPSLTHLGVGVALGMKDNVPYVYLTQNFSSGES